MGWMTRFEPATSGSTDRRSNQLSYIHHKSSIVIILIFGRFCQKNFPPRFCKPGRTNKQPLIKSAAAGHKNPAGARNFKRSHTPTGHVPKRTNSTRLLVSTRESNPLKHANTARGKRSTGCANSSSHTPPPGTKIRPGHAIPSAHAPPTGHAISSGHTNSTGRALRKAAPCKPGRAGRCPTI